jgi:hypothetical protein
MLRFLVLALLLLLVWRAAALLLQRARFGAERQMRGTGSGAVAGGEELVRCAVCGTRVPASRALAGEAGLTCSEACRRRAPGGAA